MNIFLCDADVDDDWDLEVEVTEEERKLAQELMTSARVTDKPQVCGSNVWNYRTGTFSRHFSTFSFTL